MSHDGLRLAVAQLCSGLDLERNLSRCRELVERAAELGASCCVLPENFAYLGPEVGKRALAEALPEVESAAEGSAGVAGVSGPIVEALSQMARSSGVTLVAGGMPERSDVGERPYNTCAVFGSDGALIARYRKLHLFDVELPDGSVLRESEATLAGEDVVVVEVGGWQVGLSICYDLRFPELYRALVSRGAELLLVPAAFTLQTGKDHWEVLLRARAIEAQCWVAAAGQWGSHSRERSSFGHSMIVDPWGMVTAQCSDGEGVVVADLDRGYLRSVRARLPSLRHRRL